MQEYDIEFRDKRANDIRLYVVKRPNIPAPQKNYTEHNIPGRDGLCYEDEETVDDIKIDVEFNFMENPDKWFKAFDNAKEWLFAGTGKLKFSDDAEHFYHVKKVEIGTAERTCYEIGKFTASFFCSGYHYFKSGDVEYSKLPHNPGIKSHPVYKITGTGDCALTVNGKKMTAKVVDNLTIDSDLMIAYGSGKKIENAAVSGWYEDLYLLPGENKVSITNGFDLTIIPRWRCL